MSLILNIDTAVVGASLCLADGEEILALKENPDQKDSAAWLQPAIKTIFQEQNRKLSDIAAVAVSTGPGSYTGLRVGMATAKGLCYALNVPLITISTLKMMAAAALPRDTLLCPMIDARRMEVFTGVYNKDLQEVVSPTNLIVEKESFSNLLKSKQISFFGKGSDKFRELCEDENALFETIVASAKDLVNLSNQAYAESYFADLAYAEPLYLKEFYTIRSKEKS